LAEIKWLLVMPGKTNFQLIRRSRHVPARGDIFAMQLPSGNYLFGRVVIANPPREFAPGPSTNLIYIYSVKSQNKVADHELLIPANLLLPPIWTNSLGWSKGVFETIENRPLQPGDLLRQHCFRVPLKEIFVDEAGRNIPARTEPCGEWSLASYRWVDDHVSDALSIPRAPDATEARHG
jgi:hypothetical protein